MKITLFAFTAAAYLLLSFSTLSEVSMDNLRMKILEVSPAGSVTVEITNTSKRRIRIWQESNSWGAASWRVLRIRQGQLEIFFQNPDQRFTRNIPTFYEIPPGGTTKQKLDINGGNWCGFGHCASYNERGLGRQQVAFESNDIVTVTYDVPRSNEAIKMGVWYGVAGTVTTVR